MTVISGLLPVYKPVGMTSKDVSRVLVRKFGRMKIGHVGTLDPDAEGVLPVLIGNATKLQDYLLDMPKAYSFRVKLGDFTDTLDASGNVTGSLDCSHVTESMIQSNIGYFLGKISQIPPLYSAVKLNGKELYKHARSNQHAITEEDRKNLVRNVTIYEIRLLNFMGHTFELFVKCSKGTYVRTIALDLLSRINAAGHVNLLKRVHSAGYSSEDCHSLASIEKSFDPIEKYIVPLNRLSIGLPTLSINDTVSLQRVRDGQKVKFPKSVFLNGFVVKDENFTLRSDQPILIRNDALGSIGICTAYEEADFVTIHLKRGL